MDKIGVIHGRFQMLHHGHMEYLLEGKKRCEYLIIGIANPDVSTIKYSASNPHRSTILGNPLTYYERFQMIKGALLEVGVERNSFDIVPFPINYPELLPNYVPMDAKFYMTIYDEWSREKREKLVALGCDIEVMWERSNADKFTSGTEVRNRIIKGLKWDTLVPNFVFQYVRENGIDDKIKEIALEIEKNDKDKRIDR